MPTDHMPTTREPLTSKPLTYAGAQLPGCRCAACESRRNAQLVNALRNKFDPSLALHRGQMQ